MDTHTRSTVGRIELLTHLRQLYGDLYAVIQRDPEQEVLGLALPVVDSIMSAAREHIAVSDSGIGLTIAMVDLISPRTVQDGIPVRALDTWLVVGQVLAALGDHPRLPQPTDAFHNAPFQ